MRVGYNCKGLDIFFDGKVLDWEFGYLGFGICFVSYWLINFLSLKVFICKMRVDLLFRFCSVLMFCDFSLVI